MTDEEAPPSVRLEAAKAYDAIENGRPGIARAVSVDDISSLDDDQCERLFRSLVNRIEAKQPGFFKAMMRQVVDEMLVLQATQAALPKPNRFRRGPMAGKGPEVPRWHWPPHPPTLEPCADAIRSDLSAESAAGPAQPPADPEMPLYEPVIGSRDNVVTLPGTARRPPAVSRVGPYQDDSQAAPGGNGSGGIHPDVVARSALKDPSALSIPGGDHDESTHDESTHDESNP